VAERVHESYLGRTARPQRAPRLWRPTASHTTKPPVTRAASSLWRPWRFSQP